MTQLAQAWTGFVLAWKKETNWGSALQWVPYAVARPAIAAGRPAGYLEPAYVGNAFFQIVPALLGGVSLAVIEERERYQMLKYVVLAPRAAFPFLAGHAAARAILAFLGVAVLLAAGVAFLDIRFPSFHPGLLAASLVLGFACLGALSFALAGISLLVARHGHFAAESVGGAFFLFSGAVFPADVLPAPLRAVAWASPVTWWLELVRRSFGLTFGKGPSAVSDASLLALLSALTLLTCAAGYAGWSLGFRRAKWKGLLDATTAM
jgi:ABC-2 type transport system permease protein